MSKVVFKSFLAFIFLMGCVYANELEYQDDASIVISNSLKQQPQHKFLNRLYKRLLYMPLWTKEYDLSQAAQDLFSYIERDQTLNHNGKLYNDTLMLHEKAEMLYMNGASLTDKVSLEFKISQIYEGYINYLYFGSINWGAFKARISNLMIDDVHTDWVLHRPQVEPIMLAESILFGTDLKNALDKYIPTNYRYRALQKALIRYMDIKREGGWQKVTLKTSKLKANHHDVGVPSLRYRLSITGEYKGELSDSTLYDKELVSAVKKFQKNHGLIANGVVRSSTLKELNKNVDYFITKIRLNLDRIKWLETKNSRYHIVVNIPEFMLHFEENATSIQDLRVITGKPNHPTPIFGDDVEFIVLNPYWNVPTSIIQKEMIPKLLRNPNAMKRQGIEIRSGWGKDAKLVNPASVDWGAYRYADSVPYRFAQVPGYRNALGKIKFLFPNKFSVYMHDTPTKRLFQRHRRAFSHGCVRLHKPRELLKTFASIDKNIDIKTAFKVLKGKKNTTIKLSKKVPVDIVYLTAFIDYKGELQFRDDIYRYDKMQLKSFREW